jgi:beta-glucanase (GH16 family)
LAVVAVMVAVPLALVPLTGDHHNGHASAQPPPTCQGTVPLGVAGNWTCTFDDEFSADTSLNPADWVVQQTANSGYTAGPDCYLNSPDTVSVSGGTLNLSVVQKPPFACPYPGGASFTSTVEAGMVTTTGLFNQTYGAFEVNAKLPDVKLPGLQETFWLYPQKLLYGPWPNSGEIDFAEFYSIVPWLDIPSIHYGASFLDPNHTAYTCSLNTATFNTYEVVWSPGTIQVLYNGQVCLTDHPFGGGPPFNQPFFLSLTQALGVVPNAYIPNVTPLPATTQIAWVRAWAPAP